MKNALLEFYSSRKVFLDMIDSSLVDKSLVHDREFDFSKAPIMFVGEAPGENEAKEGRPFCGAAGKNLAKLIDASGLDRKKLLITNAFAFRTFEPSAKGGFKNRTPSIEELTLGATMLLSEIKIIKPKIIVLLGGSAEKAFLKIGDKILKDAFKALQKHEIKTISHNREELSIAKTHHPSPLVFNRTDKRAELYEFFDRLYEHSRE
jgi:uracil-DNA glycosylase family 4